MSQLRLDPMTGRWVVIAGDRARTPNGLSVPAAARPGRSSPPVPVLSGQETDIAPVLTSYSLDGHWAVRVVANLYPAFSGAEPMVVTHLGPVYTQAPASGIHDVLVLTPSTTGAGPT